MIIILIYLITNYDLLNIENEKLQMIFFGAFIYSGLSKLFNDIRTYYLYDENYKDGINPAKLEKYHNAADIFVYLLVILVAIFIIYTIYYIIIDI